MIASLAGRVHVVTTGRVADDGSPAVVLASGLGHAWFDWDRVVRLLAPHTRVLVYDRPGTGDSGPALAPATLAREVAVLDAVLAGVPGAVLVGHSMAALHVEAWARLRAGRVRGLVLVDPDPEAPGAGRPFDLSALVAWWLLRLRLDRFVARHGVRLRRWAVTGSTLGRRDPAPPDQVRAVYGRPAVTRAVLEELASYPGQVAALERLRAFRPLPRVPFTVLTAGRRVFPEHLALAGQVPWGTNVLVPGSRHMVPVDRPDAVALAVLKAVRGSTV
ncbi:alpha/beta hydrolase [Saccharothrix sp. NPDC042600]|uniref:alpha/beta fold hydrolase n=1 Tax=Saccharothrix TaxID=2071 RepID=UPI0033E4BFA6|nr:alpha/beta hydrolase [Saccharothrix mutabilis subsp. capreolus]